MKPTEPLTDEALLHLLRDAAALQNAPPALVRRAIDLWAEKPLPTFSRLAGKALRRFIAALEFDSAIVAPMALGMRSAGGSTRHLLFSAVGRDIDLRVTPEAGRYHLAGQILGPDSAGEIEIASEAPAEGETVLTAGLGPMGDFHIAGISPGRYRLTLRTAEDEIVLPPIDVGEPQA